MDYVDHRSALESEAAKLGEAASARHDQPVSACPEWVAADLLSHMGRLYYWVADIIRLGGKRFEGERAQAPDGVDECRQWYEKARRAVLEEFDTHKPDDPAWTFISDGPQKVGWWARRQSLETAIHRVDAQSAGGGTADPIDASLAADGVDEFLTLFLPMVFANASSEQLKGTLHVHATDVEGEWWVDLDAPEISARREHAKADTAVRGPAAGLYQWIWNRQTADEAGLEVFGDRARVDAWRAIRI